LINKNKKSVRLSSGKAFVFGAEDFWFNYWFGSIETYGLILKANVS